MKGHIRKPYSRPFLWVLGRALNRLRLVGFALIGFAPQYYPGIMPCRSVGNPTSVSPLPIFPAHSQGLPRCPLFRGVHLWGVLYAPLSLCNYNSNRISKFLGISAVSSTDRAENTRGGILPEQMLSYCDGKSPNGNRV